MPAPPKTYRFTVTGTGQFPVDMLRYDRCWPQREGDSHYFDKPGPRHVQMEGLRQPTIARWASFGWEATPA